MDKKVSIVGVGKLGLCLGLNLESKGYNVVGIDVNESYVDLLNTKSLKTSEPHVEELLQNSNNIIFTTDISKSLEADVIFVVVSTPSTSEWKYDHTQVEQVADELIKLGKQDTRKDLVINCTTFPGYIDTLQEKLKEYNYAVSQSLKIMKEGNGAPIEYIAKFEELLSDKFGTGV